MDQRFLGPILSPRIDIVVFLVDLVGEEKRGGSTLTDAELVAHLGKDAEGAISRRVAKNRGYVNALTMRVILQRLRNRGRLVGVVFAINKMDILERLIGEGHISTKLDAGGYARELYSEELEFLTGFCNEHSLGQKLGVWCISLRRGSADVRNRFADLFDAFLAARS